MCSTSSSGFSSLLAAGGSSVTLSWVVTAAGFLRRIDPRDESVILWICKDTDEAKQGRTDMSGDLFRYTDFFLLLSIYEKQVRNVFLQDIYLLYITAMKVK